MLDSPMEINGAYYGERQMSYTVEMPLNLVHVFTTIEPAIVKEPVLFIFVAADESLHSSMSSTEKR